jgi:Spy/CpxP family protein refolding chaperone
MKSFIKVLFSVLALGLVASVTTLRAQDGEKKGKGKGGGMLTVERVEQAVGTLTADQKTKIGDILSKAQKDVQAAPDDRAKAREIMTAARKDVRAVLTADQQAKFDEMPMGGKGGKKKQQN